MIIKLTKSKEALVSDAEIQAGGERHNLGRFDILVDAETAYKRAARKLHKEFCYD